MKYLIVSTLPREDRRAQEAIAGLLEELDGAQVVHTRDRKILGCAGCNRCWLQTPGVCPIQDDYQPILVQYLAADSVIFLAEAKLGFVSHHMKDLMDRILPLATMYLRFSDGQMRHLPRYQKTLRMGLLYAGEGDGEFLNRWMERALLNLHGESLGAWELERRKEFCHALGHHQLHPQGPGGQQHQQDPHPLQGRV